MLSPTPSPRIHHCAARRGARDGAGAGGEVGAGAIRGLAARVVGAGGDWRWLEGTSGRSMLRPDVFPNVCLEPFRNTEPHDPVLLRPVQWMHNIHLADRVAEQIQAERDTRAAHEFARPAEDLRFGAVRPRDAGVIGDGCLDRQRAVIAPANVQQPERREAQLDIPDQHLAAHELIEDRAGRAAGVAALVDVEAADVIAAHQTRVPDEERVHASVFRIPAVAADVQHTRRDRKRPRRHDVFPVIHQRGDELQATESRVRFDPPAVTQNRARGAVERVVMHERHSRRLECHRRRNGEVDGRIERERAVEIEPVLLELVIVRDLKHGFNLDGSVAFDSTIHFPVPPPVTFEATGVALVHDNSFYGATSPILGDRWRIEADPTFGGLQLVTALVDYRKYIMPARPFTIAARVLHVGRYGRDAENARMYPLFIGYSSLVRGYDIGSFNVNECGNTGGSTCPVFDQLVGSKMLVGNIELRFPPFGLLHVGGGYYGALPVEAAIFYDAGVAWTDSAKAQIFGGTRKLVRSTGVSFRLNLLGYAIGQMDVVHPLDRPQKNWIVRFSITEGF